MIRYAVFVSLFFLCPARATEAPATTSPPADVVITAGEYAQLMSYLLKQPYEFSAPLINFLQNKQTDAAHPPAKTVQPAK